MGLETETQPYAEPAEDISQTDAGRQFGPYKTLRLLGKGGMGAVYLAEQQRPFRRLVALKVIKAGMDTREVIARFESERQALALMDHPNIARVFDAGSGEDGRPYFAMEYVSGTPITEYCDQNRLTNQERLELFLSVCQAVQHAHQKGIIHRDIKPSNVLVSVLDGVPVPKVIDFGVAKAINQKLVEETFFTGHGVLIGTPEYMSPEQAQLNGREVDTTSDIYSLGILLYELLVGVLPFDPKVLRHAGYEEMRRIIREEETPRPSARLHSLGAEAAQVAIRRQTTPDGLKRQLRGDLDWITAKAMAKEQTRRYASASELAADLERHLRDEPVVAGPPDLLYRVKKFTRRYRAAVAGTLAAFFALIVSLASSTFLDLVNDIHLQVGISVERADTMTRIASAMMKQSLEQRFAICDAVARSKYQQFMKVYCGEQALRLLPMDAVSKRLWSSLTTDLHNIPEVSVVLPRNNEILMDTDPTRNGLISPPNKDFASVLSYSWFSQLRVLLELDRSNYERAQEVQWPDGRLALYVRTTSAHGIVRREVKPILLRKIVRVLSLVVLATCLVVPLSFSLLRFRK